MSFPIGLGLVKSKASFGLDTEHSSPRIILYNNHCKITAQKTNSDWFIDPLTTEEVWRQNSA